MIVAIDEKSLAEHGHWPWTRDKLALMLEQLFAYGVTVVGFDMVFAERDMSSDVDLLRRLGAEQQDRGLYRRGWTSSSRCWIVTRCSQRR